MKSKYKIENYLNKKINRWTVISFSHIDIKSEQYWICRCDCGLEKSVRTSHLIRQITKGCKYCRGQSSRLSNSPYWKGGKFIPKTILTSYSLSAKKRNIDFNISIDDLENQWIKQNGMCAYTGVCLTLPKLNRDIDYNASIDRINSNIGYQNGDIVS